MAELTVQQITETGGAATYVSAASGGDTANNNGHLFIFKYNYTIFCNSILHIFADSINGAKSVI